MLYLGVSHVDLLKTYQYQLQVKKEKMSHREKIGTSSSSQWKQSK